MAALKMRIKMRSLNASWNYAKSNYALIRMKRLALVNVLNVTRVHERTVELCIARVQIILGFFFKYALNCKIVYRRVV